MTCRSPAVWFLAVRAGTGSDVFTQQLHDELRARGVQVGITWLPHRAEYLPWTVSVPRPPRWANIVHVNTWLHPRFVPQRLATVATLHHSVHDPALRPYKGALRAGYHRFWIAPIEKRVMRRANSIVAVSRYAAGMARRTLSELPVEVIHNGIDNARFRPDHEREGPHRPFRLLYVGSWMARKGVDLLAPVMRDLGDDYVLYYTGGKSARRDRSAPPSNMIDVGRLSGSEVAAAMRRSDAFLFPSRSEGFGLVVAEAMACGLPVIASSGSSLPEIVEHGVTGFLCEPDSMMAFACAARMLRCSPALWLKMSRDASSRAAGRFALPAMADAYQRVYAEVLARTGA